MSSVLQLYRFVCVYSSRINSWICFTLFKNSDWVQSGSFSSSSIRIKGKNSETRVGESRVNNSTCWRIYGMSCLRIWEVVKKPSGRREVYLAQEKSPYALPSLWVQSVSFSSSERGWRFKGESDSSRLFVYSSRRNNSQSLRITNQSLKGIDEGRRLRESRVIE